METTQTAQHTQGPWNVEPCQWDQGESTVITARGIGIICKIEPAEDNEPFTPEIDAANAVLIAAAPDLLTASDALLVEIGCLADDGVLDENGQKVIESLRSAVAKAKGGQPWQPVAK